ncbi:hypothetical protein [Luteibacter sp. ME-Dv--P-043b]|uniref:hypothetical protein n=1 Tax=Luteibacter sp. ME-Dv--P-043b TaxID=3040291 RepID=UPI0025572374|nr:hypothetical protein [Luteibacter sp. ME-Dv--P-043b]
MTEESPLPESGLAAEAQPLWKALVGFGTAAAGLTAAGILLGYQYYVAYLRRLDVPWLISEISTATFLRAGGAIVWPAILGGLMVIGLTLLTDENPHRGLRRLLIVLDVSAVLALTLALLKISWMPTGLITFCREAVQPLYGGSLGMTVVAALDRVSRGEADRLRSQFFIGHLMTSALFIYIPSTVGNLDGERDATAATTHLVVAHGPNDKADDWRLLSLEGGNALLYRAPSESNRAAARIADVHGLDFGGHSVNRDTNPARGSP